jgi:rsbT co-antagonist protein RsbR
MRDGIDHRQRRFLRQLLNWNICLAAPIACAQIGAGIGFAIPALLWSGTIIACHVVFLIGLRLFLARLTIIQIAVLIAISYITLAIVVVVPVPIAHPVSQFLLLIALILTLPTVPKPIWFGLMIIVGIASIATTVLSRFAIFAAVPFWLDLGFVTVSLLAVLILSCLLIWNYHEWFRQAMQELTESYARVDAARDSLQQEVAQRTSELQQNLTDQQQQAQILATTLREREQLDQQIRELEIPIIPVRSDTLIVPLVGLFDQQRATRMIERMLAAIQHHRATRVLVDITGVPVLDHHAAHALVQCAQAAHLLGTVVVLVGIRPEVAQALVTLGADLQSLRSYASLQQAMKQHL